MDSKKILNEDYLDILFRGKNKTYGSYELRKKYSKRALIAALVTLGVFGVGAAASLIRPSEEVIIAEAPDIKDVQLAEPPPLNENEPPPPPPAAPPPPVKPTVKFTPPVIEKNEKVRDEDLIEVPKPEEKVVVGKVTQEGSDDPNAIDPGLNVTPGTGTGPVSVAPKEEQIYRSVEQMPEFQGNIQEYLSKNIRYPAAARENEIQGRVVLQFVVDETGQVTDIKIAKDIGGGCGEEAKRVVSRMPKWKPGKQNGRAVKVYYTLPVSFTLN